MLLQPKTLKSMTHHKQKESFYSKISNTIPRKRPSCFLHRTKLHTYDILNFRILKSNHFSFWWTKYEIIIIIIIMNRWNDFPYRYPFIWLASLWEDHFIYEKMLTNEWNSVTTETINTHNDYYYCNFCKHRASVIKSSAKYSKYYENIFFSRFS